MNLLIGELAGSFFAVAGDEGDGVAAVEQTGGGFDLGGADVQFFGDGLVYVLFQHG